MKIVIAGGGFGGLRLARLLNNRPGYEVVLIDRFNYHQFQPLFYQVATAGLDASNISFPLRKVFQKSKNIRIRLATIMAVDTKQKLVITDRGNISYDMLVVATGAGTNFFGNQSLADNALSMKTTVEALQIRHRLMENFELAVTETDPAKLSRLMNIVIVGGGPTGVEVSGAIADMKKYVLPKDYPELDFSRMNIYLVEGTERVLAAMSRGSSDRALRYLNKLGVKVLTNSQVVNFDGTALELKDQDSIPTYTVIWAAGIKGHIPSGFEETSISRGNRLAVNEWNQVVGLQDVYAVGDVAAMQSDDFPNGHPQVAPAAIQQAENLAINLEKLRRGENNLQPFKYRDKGAMATVGRNLAVVEMPKPQLTFGGFPAWLVWMALHLMLILGVKNRLFVFLNWLYNYLTYDQSLRLIFKEFSHPTGATRRVEER